MAVIFIFSTGCSHYDYRTDTPVGSYEYEELLQDEIVTNTYDGSCIFAKSEPVNNDGTIYNDNNISIINLEQRYDKAILTMYLNSANILDNFTVTLAYYKDGIIIEQYTSVPQICLGGFYASLLIETPSDDDTVQLISYQGDNLGQLNSIIIYELAESSIIEQKSNTTYYCSNDLKNVVFLTEDNRIVYGQSELPEGNFVIGRNYISRYAVWEVK